MDLNDRCPGGADRERFNPAPGRDRNRVERWLGNGGAALLGLGVGGVIAALEKGRGYLVNLVLLIGGAMSAAGAAALVGSWAANRSRGGSIASTAVEASPVDWEGGVQQPASLVAWELVRAERDAQRHAFTEFRGQLDRVVRSELLAADSDRTVIVGSGRWGHGARGLVLTDQGVLLVDRKRDGRFFVKAAWPRDAVRVASFRERGETFVLSVEKRGRRFRLVIPYRERERARAVVEALGGYPAGRHRSLFYLWALCPVLNPIAWLHAAIVTRRIRYLARAIVYVVPIVIGAMIQSAHPKSSSAGGGWYAISWLICMVQVAVARKRVAEETWIRKGQVRCGEHPSAREAGQGRLDYRHQNFEDTVADNLAAGERLIASVPRVSLDAGFRREHGLYSRGCPQDAVAVTNRRVLVIRLKRRRFAIIASSPRADARVTNYEPKWHHGESQHDHVVIQASDTTVKFGVVLSMHDRGSELIAALGGVVEPALVA